MPARTGDRIVVEGAKVGQSRREGEGDRGGVVILPTITAAREYLSGQHGTWQVPAPE